MKRWISKDLLIKILTKKPVQYSRKRGIMYKQDELFTFEESRKALQLCYSNSLTPEFRLNKCSAWYKFVVDAVILKSYNTVVASIYGKTCYVYGYYSKTTQQHIRKFYTRFNCEVVIYLYNRSDKLKEKYV